MNTLLEIEKAIGALSSTELNELYTWMDQNCPIDAQLEAGLKAGHFDHHIDRALTAHRDGLTQPL